MLRFLVSVLVALCLASTVLAEPTIFLTPQRLKRLRRDRDRQTPRWINFEKRVNTVPDSPERGFELALYYAITGDEARGREAVAWLKEHRCRPRLDALLHDWIDQRLFDEDKTVVMDEQTACLTANAGTVNEIRDSLFQHKQLSAAEQQSLVEKLQNGTYRNGADLYAALETVSALRSIAHVDLRDQADKFFAQLPVRLLLSLQPKEVEHPDWQTHIAALALVSLNPNNDNAQFLQAWAIEDRQMLHDGPGVAYELLWADPYLPGVGYQNLDPWLFDDQTGALLARTNWNDDACWISMDASGRHSRNCPPDWSDRPMQFGHMQLLPLTNKCASVDVRPNQAQILSHLEGGEKLRFEEHDGRKQTSSASPTGLWRVALNVSGKVCALR